MTLTFGLYLCDALLTHKQFTLQVNISQNCRTDFTLDGAEFGGKLTAAWS
jgi:hypothetical protein